MKNYSNLLPRRVSQNDYSTLCQHLDADGASCENYSEIECFVFEDINDEWHSAFFCDKHAKLRKKIPVDEETNFN